MQQPRIGSSIVPSYIRSSVGSSFRWLYDKPPSHFVVLAMSVLDPIWTPPPAETAKLKGIKGLRNQVELEETRRSRSPRPRHRAVKAFLKSWATGETSSVGIWRLAYAIVRVDGTDAGYGMSRLAALSTETSGSTINCSRNLKKLLAETALTKMIRGVPHEKKTNARLHTSFAQPT